MYRTTTLPRTIFTHTALSFSREQHQCWCRFLIVRLCANGDSGALSFTSFRAARDHFHCSLHSFRVSYRRDDIFLRSFARIFSAAHLCSALRSLSSETLFRTCMAAFLRTCGIFVPYLVPTRRGALFCLLHAVWDEGMRARNGGGKRHMLGKAASSGRGNSVYSDMATDGE
jgi:hypothetical protein